MKHRISILALLFALILTLTACSSLGGSFEETTVSETAGTGNPAVPQGSAFAVHFIDVGQADAALIVCDGKAMLIDGGNVGDSDLVYTYLKKQNISHLDYVVCTHAHEDHVGGLSGALSAATAGKVYAPVREYDTRAFRNFAEKAEAFGGIVIPAAGEQFSLGAARVTVLGPAKSYDDPNNTSIVLRVEYGQTSFLFTGDMETLAEGDLLDAGTVRASTVLKVGHHGSSTSTSYRFLRTVAPTHAVISVGTDNEYGHPHDEVLSRLRDADVTVWRTDMQGDIVCTSDGTAVTFYTAIQNNLPTNPTEGEKTTSDDSAVSEYACIGNLNTQKYHTPTCSALPAEQNRIYFTSVEEATTAGYTPCGLCGTD